MDQDFHSETRQTTAFFATREAADKVVRDLSAIGYGTDRVRMEPSATAEGGLVQSDAERGEAGGSSHGYIVRVTVTNADFERVTSILDDDATVTLDARTAVRTGARAFSGGQGGSSGRFSSRQGASNPLASLNVDSVVDYIRQKPLQAVGFAFGIGLFLGRR
jgi:ElaB/YqjD/DUF883 family membrane-anchored ribosome-binding protein